MSEPKLISPLLDDYIMGEAISDHHGIRCCPAIKKDTDEKYIVKILSIPASSVQLDALLLTGAYPTEEAALAYFRELAESTIAEAELLQQLSKLEGFVGFDGWQLEPMEDGKGFDVYLIGAYRPTLERHLPRNPMTHLSAVNLGLDMCAAMSVARQSGYLYADLKPENIVLTGEGEYRVGDLGLISLDSLKFASLPEKYRSAYTAPEITDAYSTLNSTIDIYAAGMILYQVYNNGLLPSFAENAPLSAPEYADPEMAEIILKACALSPDDRWQTPLEMGQALIGYMQRYDVTDTPIIPLPTPSAEEETSGEADPAEAAETEVAEEAAEADIAPIEAEDFAQLSEEEQLSYVLSDEAAAHEEIPDELEDAPVTEEVEEMLSQADELIAHETPDPVIQPDPIDVPVPPLVIPEEEPEEAAEEAEETENTEETDAVEQADSEKESTEEVAEETTKDESEAVEVVSAPAEEETTQAPKRGIKRLFAGLVVLLTLSLLAIGGVAFYDLIYTQTIRDISVSGYEDKLTVVLDTKTDNSLLTVVCTNTYGSSIRASVKNNTAYFSGLTPDTQYRITVEISGFHRLEGTTTESYTTEPRSEIVSFTALTGAADGSVILNFVVQGHDESGWTVAYSAIGEAEKTVSFTGHMVTINGLTVGKDYTFRIVPSSTQYITGQHTISYKASRLIFAEELTVLGFTGNTLNVKWNTPSDVTVPSWTLRCYNDTGFDTTITVTESQASIPDLDPTAKYTIDICAAGMSQGTQTHISANSITLTEMTVDDTTADQLYISWTFEGNAPEGGWLLLYSVNGTEAQVIHCDDNSGIISVLIPNSRYDISVKPASGVSIFGEGATYTTADHGTFSGYRVSAANMEFKMCLTPNKANWTRYDVKAADYTNNFAVGQRASFLIHLKAVYSTSNDTIVTRFVIRDKNGNPVIVEDSIRTWTKMWRSGYCSLDIPAMPQTPDNYTVDIYFNNAYVTTQSFAVQ